MKSEKISTAKYPQAMLTQHCMLIYWVSIKITFQ